MATGKAGELLDASGVAGASGFSTGNAFHVARWTPKTEVRGVDDAPEREPGIVSRELGVSACFSPDSTRAAIQTATAIEIWDVAARKRQLRIEGATVVALPLAFSSDWSRLVTTPDDLAHLEIWDLSTGQSTRLAAAADDQFASTSFSPDGSILAAAELGTSKVRLWRLDDFTELPPLAGHAEGLVSVRFLNDGKTLASADAGGRVKLWDVKTWRERLHLYLEEIPDEGGISIELNNIADTPILSRVHVAKDDLVVQADATTVQVWNGSTGRLRAAVNDGGEPVFHTKASPDGRILLLKHTNHTSTLWDVETARLVKRLGTASVGDLYTAFSTDGKTLAVTTDSGKTIELWDPAAGALLHRVTLDQERACNWLRFSPDNRQLLATCADDSLRVYGAEYGRLSPVNRKGVLAAAADAQAERLALADDQGTIVIVRLPSGSPLHAISAHKAAIRGVAFSPNGSTLASASDDETCRLWDVESGELLRSLENTRGRLGNVAFMPNGDYVAAPHYRGITIWNAASGETKWHLDMGSFARAIAFAPNGKSALATESLSPMRLWKMPDAPTARPTFTNLGGHETGALCAAYSPDAKVIATGGADGKICLWTAEGAAQPNGTLDAHGDWVHSLAFSSDGNYLVSAGADQKLCLWDVAGRKKRHSVDAPGGSARCLTRLAASDEFISAGSDGVPRIWKLTASGDEATLAETRALQNIEVLAQSLRPAPTEDGADRPKESTDRIDVAVEESAVRLVSRLFDEQPLPDDVVEMIRRDESLSDAVRKRAIILAKRRRVDAQRLNNLAWRTALLPGKTSREYEQALRLIRAATRLEPENGMLANTLGAAEYRAGQYDQAIASLSRSAALNRQRLGTPAPHDLVFMAMAQAKLGQMSVAASTLKQARAIADGRLFPIGDPDELKRLLDEAAELIEKAQE
jgi:WD40 repeat protein